MFGDKARRIEELATLLTHTRLMKDYYAERNLVLEKELRITNKACRNKKKLSKALHEANKKIKQLEAQLKDSSLRPVQVWHTFDINAKPPNCDGMEVTSP